MTIEVTWDDRVRILLKKVLSAAFAATGGFRIFCRLAKPSVTILVYHRILEDDSSGVVPYISITRSKLRKQIRLFKKYYTIIPLEEAVDRLKNNAVNRRYLALTFDDGYRDFYSIGLPIFQEEGISPTVFVTTECVESQTALWPDMVRSLVFSEHFQGPVVLNEPQIRISGRPMSRIHAVTKIIAHLKTLDTERRDAYLRTLRETLGCGEANSRLMLTWQELKSLKAGGMSIGSHTVNHPVLANVDPPSAMKEVVESKAALESHLGSSVTLFAYPNGRKSDYTTQNIEMLKEAGYLAAVTTERGHNTSVNDLFRLRRTGIYATDALIDIKLKLVLEEFIG